MVLYASQLVVTKYTAGLSGFIETCCITLLTHVFLCLKLIKDDLVYQIKKTNTLFYERYCSDTAILSLPKCQITYPKTD
jgi:hypothetical protein